MLRKSEGNPVSKPNPLQLQADWPAVVQLDEFKVVLIHKSRGNFGGSWCRRMIHDLRDPQRGRRGNVENGFVLRTPDRPRQDTSPYSHRFVHHDGPAVIQTTR